MDKNKKTFAVLILLILLSSFALSTFISDPIVQTTEEVENSNLLGFVSYLSLDKQKENSDMVIITLNGTPPSDFSSRELQSFELGRTDKTIVYEYGKIRPRIREGEELKEYFRSLDIGRESIYTLVTFKTNLTQEQSQVLFNDGAELIGDYGRGVYLVKFPKEVLETKSYDFVKWIDVPKKDDKIEQDLKNSLDLDNSLLIKIEFYEDYTDEELKELNRYAKFINKDDWEPDEHSLFALVGPKESIDSIHSIEEIAAFNFIKTVSLINIEDKRKLNLFVNQSDFYENKTLANQPHGICPWQRDDSIIPSSSLTNLPQVLSKKEISDNSSFDNFLQSKNSFRKVFDFSKEEGYTTTKAGFEIIFSDGTVASLIEINKGLSENVQNSFLVLINNEEERIERSYIMEVSKSANIPTLKFYDSEGGTEISLLDRSIVSSWGEHSCDFNTCLIYGFDFYSSLWGPCVDLCGISLYPPNPWEIAACYGCLLGLGISQLEICAVNSCEFYPCQQDCNDQDGTGSFDYYCYQGDVWRRQQLTDYECSSAEPREGMCEIESTQWTNNQFFEECDFGCSNGECSSEIECYSDSDCPADGWVGSRFCSGGDVHQTYRDYTCINDGSPSSYCQVTDTEEEFRDCNNGCSNGQCTGGTGIQCDFDEREEDCINAEEERVQLYIQEDEAIGRSVSDFAEICGEDHCVDKPAYAMKFDIDDCDGDLNDNMLDEVLRVRLKWWNDFGENDCSDTDLRFYERDEDELDDPSLYAEELTTFGNWDTINSGAGACHADLNILDISTQYVDDLNLDDDDEIAYVWWPDYQQDQWGMDDAGDPYLDIEYCAACPDADSDGSHRESANCGTEDDCDDYNPHIRPGTPNVYCDCNAATGGGATQGTSEICDNVDNDCDGSTDESLSQGCGFGICSGGVQSCSSGSWGTCSTSGLATSEMCNSLDDDCDGTVDESLSQQCGTDEGACVVGTQSCSAGAWGTCGGTYVGPTNETCNGIDDNCNGITDESNICGNYPNVTLVSPLNSSIQSSSTVNFNCSATDNLRLSNISLYHNLNGTFLLNSTRNLTGTSNSTTWQFTNVPDGTYSWNCLAYDNDTHFSFGAAPPYNFTIDTSDIVPTVTLVSPSNNSVDTDGSLIFNCSATDDINLKNITLYGNWTGTWHANETKSLTGTSNSTTFSKTLSSGIYRWNCLAYDNSSQPDWGNSNFTLNVSVFQNQAPKINSVTSTPTVQGFGELVVLQANVTDSDGQSDIRSVWVGVTPTGASQTNYTMTNTSSQIWRLSNYTNFLNGTYTFRVYANDSAGNLNSNSSTFTMYINFTVQIHTLEDVYDANELVSLTDPPGAVYRTKDSDTVEHVEGIKTTTIYSAPVNIFDEELGYYAPLTQTVKLDQEGNDLVLRWNNKEAKILLKLKEKDGSISDVAQFKAENNVNYEIIKKDYKQSYKFDWKFSDVSREEVNKIEEFHVEIEDVEGTSFIRDGTKYIFDDGLVLDLSDLEQDYNVEKDNSKDNRFLIKQKNSNGIRLDSSEIVLDPIVSLNAGNDTADIRYQNSTAFPKREGMQLKWKISEIPSTADIQEAKLCLNITTIAGSPDNDIIYWRIENQTWNESTSPSLLNDQIKTDETTDRTLSSITNYTLTCLDITPVIRKDRNLSNNYSTVRIEDLDYPTNFIAVNYELTHGPGQQLTIGQNSHPNYPTIFFRGRDDSQTNARPYLNVTYSLGKTTPEINQSKIVNRATNSSFYLLMKVEYWNGTNWTLKNNIINDSSSRRLQSGETLPLDFVWNPMSWNTANNVSGTYRVYIAATDDRDNILRNINGSLVQAFYNFSINLTSAPASNSTIDYGIGTEADGTTVQRTWIYVNVTANVSNEQKIVFNLYNRSVSTNGLVAWWAMDENRSTLLDRSLNGNDVTVIGFVNYTPSGKINGALDFNGGANGLAPYANDTSSLDVNKITVAAWIHADADDQDIIRKWETSGNQRSWAMTVTQNNKVRFFVSPDGTAASAKNVTSTSSVTTFSWRFVVATYNGSQMKIYVDGVNENTTALTGNIFNSNSSVKIGDNLIEQYDYFGQMDEIRIYNRSLSAGEISEMYKSRAVNSSTFTNGRRSINWTNLAYNTDYHYNVYIANSSNQYVTRTRHITLGNPLAGDLSQIDVHNLEVVYSNNTQRIFKFAVKNMNDSLLGISWNLTTGNNNFSSQNMSVLNSEEDLFVYIYNNYTSSGNYSVTAYAEADSYSDSETIGVTI